MVGQNEWTTAKYVVICTDPDADDDQQAWPCDTLEEARATKNWMEDEGCLYVHYWRELS